MEHAQKEKGAKRCLIDDFPQQEMKSVVEKLTLLSFSDHFTAKLSRTKRERTLIWLFFIFKVL